MEGEIFNTIQKQETVAPIEGSHEAKSLPELSFIPPELIKKEATGLHLLHNLRETCAAASIIFGGISLISWVVILFGLLASIAGITLSVVGFKSSGSKYARIGLGLSIVGFVASLLYAYAAYQGMINYNYFTSEFWG